MYKRKKKEMREWQKYKDEHVVQFGKSNLKKNDKVKAKKGAKLIAKTGKGEDFMAGSPLDWYSKPAQSLLRQDGSQYMTRVIPQPGDTVYIEPEWVDMKNTKYPAYRNKFNELWNKRNKPSAKPKATK